MVFKSSIGGTTLEGMGVKRYLLTDSQNVSLNDVEFLGHR